jgi:ubiquinone/menaquinone biosynthesis C-methylase UbiE
MSLQTHRSDATVLNRRTLETDQRVLAGLLRPGLSALDVGCGTGAITAGIARAVAPGEVIGVDRDSVHIEAARAAHREPNLCFEVQDAIEMTFESRFDVVASARAVQWMTDPAAAVRRMAAAANPGGLVVVLDYNQAGNSWTPEPPPEYAAFYAKFLAWRERRGWDNWMADHLPELFAQAGLVEIESHDCDEISGRGSVGAETWLHVISSIGPEFASEEELARAADAYRRYIETRLDRQTHSMRTVVGRKAV